jgi:hypothetical protein
VRSLRRSIAAPALRIILRASSFTNLGAVAKW